MKKLFTIVLLCLSALTVQAEDGHSLWLRYKGGNHATVCTNQKKPSPTLVIAQKELSKNWQGDEKIILVQGEGNGKESFTLQRTDEGIQASSATDKGLLYAAYTLLRMQETGEIDQLTTTSITETPSNDIRILNHWDNPNGTVERGYAGSSLWKWDEITPTLKAGKEVKWKNAELKQRITDYARANASIGINATVLNNVNAKPLMLSSDMIGKTASIADILRPYGIKVYLAVNFGSPHGIGDLDTADPLNPEVVKWWQKKVAEIYTLIPDFGGFLVKANSEGEPGPMDYNRTHVDGANMLADALHPHGGIVMWRSFVYASDGGDRANQAYTEFKRFDGQFRNNVIIQIKNGPIDFQPREPISPLFFGLEKTRTMPEFQITQEYTGHSIHTCFLAPMWKEFFGFQSMCSTPKAYGQKLLAGVANIGDDINWCGNDLAQANWYAFGRLAWNEELSSEQIAREFLAQTFTNDPKFVEPITELLLHSRETVVSYMMPLGLHHIFAGGHHYGPEPWCAPKGWREDWLPRYYHRADNEGIGFDRTHNGSKNTEQYPEPLRSLYDNINTCPENLLLWFHHASWNHLMSNGLTLWHNLCGKYEEGAQQAEKFVEVWKQVKPYIDSERYESMLWRLQRQARDAWWWHDACILYFQQFSQLPIPSCITPMQFKLDDLMKVKLPIDNYRAPKPDMLP
ncbi:MAG: alpha-glucuronidase [Bacteroidaceae bacterium]|nr:alpha-glucuronidase [Bacteroidaceae bacterium]